MEMGEKFRSNSFYIVQSPEVCWKCKKVTQVVAFLLPESHERVEYIYNEDESTDVAEWSCISYYCFLNYVSYLNKDLLKLVQKISEDYYYDFSKTTGDHYYMNHCEHCHAKQGDFFLFSEPGGSFCPLSSQEAESMKLYVCEYLFEAKAGGYSSVNFFDHMQEMDIEMAIEYGFENSEIDAEESIMQDKLMFSENAHGLRFLTLIVQMVTFKIKTFFYNAYIFIVRNNWHLSKNGNFYNPIVRSTVYPNGLGWNIVRYGVHYPDFSSRKEAMAAALEMWLEERSLKSSV